MDFATHLHIGWPQGIYLTLTLLGFWVIASKHGQPRTGRYDLASSSVLTACILAVLWWGGFFG